MSDAFITLWSQPQLEIERRGPGGPLSHTANRQYRARGVTRGDRVYVVATDAGQLLLLGRLEVERVVGQAEADKYFGGRVYEAPDHLIGSGTELRLDRVVPEDIARRIRRDSGKPVKIAADRYAVDANSLRTTGRITDESADLLDHVLGLAVQVRTDPEFHEGKKSMRLHLSVERSPRVRRAAIALQGIDCKICGFGYRKAYGPIGEGFIEVHHLSPLGKLRAEVAVNPSTDVIVVCANCHRMVHRRDPPIAPDEMRALLRQGS